MYKNARAMVALLRGQMIDWIHSPRTLIMGIIILLLTLLYANGYKVMLQSSDLFSYFGESFYVYLSSGFGNITLTSAMFLIMVSEIPRRIAFQNDMLIRCSRGKWLRSQILFCFLIVSLMLILMTAFCMILTLPSLTSGRGWSDLDRIAADPDAAFQMQLVPEYIRSIPPWQASLLAGANLFAFWFVMVLVILALSLAGKPNFGLILYVFLLVLHVTVMWERIPGFRSPANYATLSAVASMYPEHELEMFPIVLAVYACIILLMIGIMHLEVRHMDMCFDRKERYDHEDRKDSTANSSPAEKAE